MEHKQLKYPDYPFWSDGNYDYIGAVSFDSKFTSYDKVEIISDIDLVVNNGYVYMKSKKYSLR
ncbi:MAG: hypothetical protein K6A89_07940 [Treponema sp.]|nr:hypothetical protein [Treponema sp.]